MSMASESVTVNKQALIDILVSLEYRESTQILKLIAYTRQLQEIVRGLEQLFCKEEDSRLKNALMNLFLTDAEWSRVFTSAQIDAWYAELENR